ncbi:hypothetical protein BJ742DRAFT_776333 [Cladochytrium replicatum]|nr:hypothetical protein BJ742DRAFT_776333 [Cladochytrium replicatum]
MQDVLNPSIITAEEELDDFLSDHLTPNKLLQIAKAHSLDAVRKLELKVDTRRTTLGYVGITVPKVEYLRLDHSRIPQIRDLGSGFSNLRVLSMMFCNLVELDGIGSFTRLEELYVGGNDIVDLYPLSLLEHIRTIDLQNNAISDLDALEYLALCPELTHLTLKGNPLGNSALRYKHEVAALLPHLKSLDGDSLSDLERSNKISPSDLFSNSVKPAQPQSTRLSTSRPTSSRRPSSAANMINNFIIQESDSSSFLTHGFDDVMAGNPILSLRARKASLRDSSFVSTSSMFTSSPSSTFLCTSAVSSPRDSTTSQPERLGGTLSSPTKPPPKKTLDGSWTEQEPDSTSTNSPRKPPTDPRRSSHLWRRVVVVSSKTDSEQVSDHDRTSSGMDTMALGKSLVISGCPDPQ